MEPDQSPYGDVVSTSTVPVMVSRLETSISEQNSAFKFGTGLLLTSTASLVYSTEVTTNSTLEPSARQLDVAGLLLMATVSHSNPLVYQLKLVMVPSRSTARGTLSP